MKSIILAGIAKTFIYHMKVYETRILLDIVSCGLIEDYCGYFDGKVTLKVYSNFGR